MIILSLVVDVRIGQMGVVDQTAPGFSQIGRLAMEKFKGLGRLFSILDADLE